MNLGKMLSSMIKPELEELKSICEFSEEELKIIQMLRNRKTNIEIAQATNSSIATIDRRIKNIKIKIKRSEYQMEKKVPIWEKLNITIEEAAEYSNVGICKLQELTKRPNCPFVLYVGKKKLIKREAFEEFIKSSIEL